MTQRWVGVVAWIVFLAGSFIALGPKYQCEAGWYRNLPMATRQMQQIAMYLRMYASQYENYPSMEEGLAPLHLVIPADQQLGISSTTMRDDEYYWSTLNGNGPFLISQSGIFSAWHIPFIYENRRNVPESVFADSPSQTNDADFYSLRVDKGIHLVAFSGAHQYVLWRWKTSLMLIPPVVALFVIFYRCKQNVSQTRGKKALLWLKTIAAVGACIWIILVSTTTFIYYHPSFFNKRHRPEFLAKRAELMDRYEANGAISHEAAARLRTALDDDLKRLDDIEKGL